MGTEYPPGPGLMVGNIASTTLLMQLGALLGARAIGEPDHVKRRLPAISSRRFHPPVLHRLLTSRRCQADQAIPLRFFCVVPRRFRLVAAVRRPTDHLHFSQLSRGHVALLRQL